MEKIYLVFEQGNGKIHSAHTQLESANQKVKELEAFYDMECFEVLSVILED